MFNQKKRKIESLEKEIIKVRKENCGLYKERENLESVIKNLDGQVTEQTIVSNKFAKVIETQAVEIENLKKELKKKDREISDLKACFEPQVTMCEEIPSEPQKEAKKSKKTEKKVNNSEIISKINHNVGSAQIEANQVSLKGKNINLTGSGIKNKPKKTSKRTKKA